VIEICFEWRILFYGLGHFVGYTRVFFGQRIGKRYSLRSIKSVGDLVQQYILQDILASILATKVAKQYSLRSIKSVSDLVQLYTIVLNQLIFVMDRRE
jgi:hypothetical protein